MKNKKIVTILLDRGHNELTQIMFQKTLGTACDNLKRAGKYRGKADFIEQIEKTAHKYRKYVSVKVDGETFPVGNGELGVYLLKTWKIPNASS